MKHEIELHNDCNKVIVQKALYLRDFKTILMFSVKWFKDGIEKYHQDIVVKDWTQDTIVSDSFLSLTKAWDKIDGYPPQTEFMGIMGYQLNE